MFRFLFNSKRTRKPLALVLLLGLCVALPLSSAAKKKKTAAAPAADVGPRKFPFDPKKLVWPAPPNVGRIHWMNYFAGARVEYNTDGPKTKPKASWMDRLAG